MILTAILLIIGTFIGGWATIPFKYKPDNIFMPLIFGGSYLFSITVINISPEPFALSSNPTKIGLVILLGFSSNNFLSILPRVWNMVIFIYKIDKIKVLCAYWSNR